MYKVLVFAGTVEGRAVADYLNEKKIPARICVATEYGESLLPRGECLEISHVRLTAEEMETLMVQMEEGLVVDATHPYAKEVTENIRLACEKTGREYIRLVRDESRIPGSVVYVKSVQEAVQYLEGTKGNILVTTGSKELAVYTELTDYRERVFARVLSLPEVVDSCARLGFQGKHLICMQGPFSRELNEALIRQVKASWMVTKESGEAGGFLEKYQAACAAGCSLVVIGRPEKEEGRSLENCLEYISRKLDCGKTAEETKEERPGGKTSAEKEPREISLVGIGMGTLGTMTREGETALGEAQLLIGAARMLEQVGKPGQDTFVSYKPEEICSYLEQHPEYRKAAVALSGDVGFYSGSKKLLESLKRELPKARIRLVSGISSMIYFCSKLQTSWEDIRPVSLHGRDGNVVGLLKEQPRIFAIVGNRDGIARVCQKLAAYGMGKTRISVGERLSYPEEKITGGYAEDFQEYSSDPLSVMLLEREDKISRVVTHGISDDCFLRGKVPMTKEEVRSISLSKLRLERNSVIYDIGAGTGSVSVEMAAQAVEGRVYAVEKKPEAVELLQQNKRRFQADNLEIVEGLAPKACEGLPAPTHAFIGGSSGNLQEILKLLLAKNPRVRIVVNCITLETVAEALEAVRSLPLTDIDIAQVTVAKGKPAGPYHLMMGQNPVYVISCTGELQ